MDEEQFRHFAHELRTPLSVIQSTSEAVLIGSPDEESKEALTVILDQVQRISDLVNGVSRQ